MTKSPNISPPKLGQKLIKRDKNLSEGGYFWKIGSSSQGICSTTIAIAVA